MANSPLGFPFGFYVADNSPIDGKYGVISGGMWRPYNDVAEALATLPLGARHIGLTINIANVEYWWEQGDTDGDLVIKSAGGGGVSFGTARQIPFTDNDGDGFLYSSGIFEWNDAKRTLIGGATISAATPSSGYGIIIGENITLGSDWSWSQIFGDVHAITPPLVNSLVCGTGLTVTGGAIANSLIVSNGTVFSGNAGKAQDLVTGSNHTYNVTSGATGNNFIAGGLNTISGAGISEAFVTGRQSQGSAPGVFVHGWPISDQNTRPIIASGLAATNISANSSSQGSGDGALADYSAILGGVDHNIPSDSPRSAIIGGNAIKARAAAADQVYVPNLNIATTPLNDNALTQVLIRDNSTGQIKYRDASTLGGGGISGLTTNRIPYATSATTLGDDSALTWDATNNILTVNGTRLHGTNTNTFLGNGAGNTGMSGLANIGIGLNALDALTNAGENTGVGTLTLSGVTSGDGNTALGYGAGTAITTGNYNIAIGHNVMVGNVTTDNNIAIGRFSLQVLTGGTGNIALGFSTANATTTGSRNVVIGYDIDAQSATGNDQLTIQNIIFGTGNAGTGTTVSTGNIGIGVPAPNARLHLPAGSASANTAPLKLTSGTALTTPENGAMEYHSSHLYFTIGSTRFQLDQQGGGLSGLTTNRIPYATSPTTIGDDSALTWDATNNALTIGATRFFTTAKTVDDLFIGETAGNFTSTGGGANIGIGEIVLAAITTGEQNTIVGRQGANGLTTGFRNTGIGALVFDGTAITGADNVAVGYDALGGALTSGSRNIALGAGSGGNISTGNQNLLIGYGLSAQSATSDGQLSIQNIIFGTGNSATSTIVSTGSIGIGTPAPDRRFHVEQETATTNGVTYVQRLTSTSSGTPAAGIGAGIEFEVETSAANNEVGASIEAVVAETTLGSERFVLSFRVMNAGAIQSAMTVSNPSGIATLSTIQALASTLKIASNGGASTRRLDVEENSTSTNTVLYPVRLIAVSSNTPANGIGTGLEFVTETSNNNNEVGATIEAVTTDVTSASEDFDLIVKTMAAGAAATEKLRITSDGRLYGTAIHNNAGAITGTTNQYIASGTYTPTLTAVSNVSASTAQITQYMRVGNVVTVGGLMDITPTAGAGTSTAIRISLPVASNFASSVQCGGVAHEPTTPQTGAIQSDAASDEAVLSFVAQTTGSRSFRFTFTYLIV